MLYGTALAPSMTLVANVMKLLSRVLETKGNVRDARRLHSITWWVILVCYSRRGWEKIPETPEHGVTKRRRGEEGRLLENKKFWGKKISEKTCLVQF